MFIAFEGLDGSGLSTHSRLLVKWLNSRGYRAVYTKEPTPHSPLSSIIRDYLARPEPLDDLLALLFAADRIWHLQEDPRLPGGGILGALSSGFIVVCDRYKYSSIAYQGSGVGIEWVEMVNLRARDADLILYLDVPVEVAYKRASMRGRREVYEAADRMRRIKEVFDEVLKRAESRGVNVARIQGVDASGGERSIEDVQGEIRSVVLRFIAGLERR